MRVQSCSSCAGNAALRIAQDEKFGTVAKWRKHEGEKVLKGQDLCEVVFTNFSINLTMEEDSYVAQILVPEGADQTPVGAPLCVMVEKEVCVIGVKCWVPKEYRLTRLMLRCWQSTVQPAGGYPNIQSS